MIKQWIIVALLCTCSTLAIAESQAIFKMSQKHVQPGDVIRIDIFSKKTITNSTIRVFKKNHYFIKQNKGHPIINQYYYFIGVPRRAANGKHPVTIILKSGNTLIYKATTHVTVHKKEFKTTKLSFAKRKTNIVKNRSQLASESSQMAKWFKKTTRLRYFDQTPFILPSKGRFSSKFGAVRSYNGRYTRHHSGLDIANRVGTPIRAPQSGKVVLRNHFKTHGKTVMVDHGIGVISVFNHMSKIKVKTGQFVNKGDIIGEIGMTGLATGPHVHWGVSVGNTRVDPLEWVRNKQLWL